MLWSETNQLYICSDHRISIIDPLTLEEIFGRKVILILKSMITTVKTYS